MRSNILLIFAIAVAVTISLSVVATVNAFRLVPSPPGVEPSRNDNPPDPKNPKTGDMTAPSELAQGKVSSLSNNTGKMTAAGNNTNSSGKIAINVK
jgi:hypothetical protein